MVSGPTNSQCSGTIRNDRGRTAFGSKHRKNRCIGLELAYKRWSLTIAEGRGQPDISGVTFGVTQSGELELPHEARLIACLCENKVFARTRESLDGVNSISHAELELADHESCIFM